MPENTVIILGTGATRGSGYAREGTDGLPGDQGFFAHDLVKARLKAYPALQIMLDAFFPDHGENGRTHIGLEAVWSFLEFSPMPPYRGLADLTQARERWLRLIRQRDVPHDANEMERRFVSDRTLPPLPGIDLQLLAGWDLRRLVADIYSELRLDSFNRYEALLKENKFSIPEKDPTTFISLNYDCVLEHALDAARIKWHYRDIQTEAPRSPNGIRVVKPHGSLNWGFEGNDPPVRIWTDYQREPITHRSESANRFRQAMIIPPTQLKQEIHGGRTQLSVTQALIDRLWKSMAEALFNASRVFIIGYSFPPTDIHLRTLFRMVNQKRGKRPYGEVHYCTLADGKEDETVAVVQQLFPSAENEIRVSVEGFELFAKPE